MVIDRGAFLSGRYGEVYDQIVRVRKEACGHAHLKVILETGELGSYDAVRRASLLAMAAGADFIKTSTGKISPAATLPVTLCMLEAIRDFYAETERKVGMKPAGGIRHAKQAIQYLCLVNETLGAEWLTPELFRFGASSLLNDVLMQIRTQKTGVLRVSRSLHDRLTWGSSSSDRRVSTGHTRRLRSRARSCSSRSATASSSAASWSSPPRASGSRAHRRRPRSRWQRWPRRAPRTSTARSRRHATRSPAGRSCGRPSGPSTCSGSRASCRSEAVSWRSPSRSTAASRSRSRATSICRWPPPTSSTTPAGPTSSSTPSPTDRRARWAWPRRSSRGTSRC